MAKISDLSTLSTLEIGDLLLVSRLNNTIASQDNSKKAYISFNMDAIALIKQLSSTVYSQLSIVINPFFTSAISVLNVISSKYDEHVKLLNDHIDSCNEILNRLKALSNQLENSQNTFIDNLNKNVQSLSSNLSNTLTSNFNKLSNDSNSTLTAGISNISTTNIIISGNILDYISRNYVSLTGDNIIYGHKRFINPISAMALSAKWN